MTCKGCRDGGAVDFAFSMAFQPIVDLTTGEPYAYEALVRGPNGEGAGWVLGQVTDGNRYGFDQSCRVKAIETAVAAGLLASAARLSINFLPNAVYSPVACIQLTIKTARAAAMPIDRLIFEFTEGEEISDPAHLGRIVDAYKQMGFGTALDDFGAGHSGLAVLARFQPDTVKLDRELIRDLDSSLPRRMIVEALVRMAAAMNIRVVAEGVEREGELDVVRALGIRYAQGYYFARPAFERLPPVLIDAQAADCATG